MARSQVCARDEVHDDQIILPAERTKNHRTHVVPLSDAAKAILGTVNGRGRVHVFGRDDTGFKGWDAAKEALDARIAADRPLPHWTTHDIRRTVATGMAELGIPAARYRGGAQSRLGAQGRRCWDL